MLRAVFLAALAAALLPATATAADDGLIAFTVAEAGIDVVGPDGAGRRPLLRESGAYSPDWSPDGRWVAYSGGELRVAAADGSPDGTMLAFERVDARHRIPPWEPSVRLDDEGTRVIGLGFCTLSLATGVWACRDSYSKEHAPAWGSALGRLAYVGRGAGAPDVGFLQSALWVTDLVTGTPYRLARWAYDARVVDGDLRKPADPSVGADGFRIAVSALGPDDVRQIAVVRTLERRPGGLDAPTWQVVDAHTFFLGKGTQPAWEARRAPLPAGADGAFDRRTRVRARLRRGRLTLVNRNRFVVTARVGRRELRLPPRSMRHVRSRSRRVRIADVAGNRRAIRVT